MQEEIELVKNFLTIEQIRFPEKFDVEYNIDEDVRPCKVLKLTLQPIVENAIKHGISMQRERGLIKIYGYRLDNDLIIEVIDNGAGFDVEQLAANSSSEYKNGGYGLHNVDERIKLEYGKNYGIKIYSTKNIGTRAEIKLKADYVCE